MMCAPCRVFINKRCDVILIVVEEYKPLKEEKYSFTIIQQEINLKKLALGKVKISHL